MAVTRDYREVCAVAAWSFSTGAVGGPFLASAVSAASVTATAGVVAGTAVMLACLLAAQLVTTIDLVNTIENPDYQPITVGPTAPLEDPPVALPPATQVPWIPAPPTTVYPTGAVWPSQNAAGFFTQRVLPLGGSSTAVVSLDADTKIRQAPTARPGGLFVTVAGSDMGTISNPVQPVSDGVMSFISSTEGLLTISFDPNTGDSGVWRARNVDLNKEWFLLVPGLTAEDQPVGTFTGVGDDDWFTVAFSA